MSVSPIFPHWLSFSSAASAVIIQHHTNIYVNIKTYHSSAVLLINDFFRRKQEQVGSKLMPSTTAPQLVVQYCSVQML